MKILVVDDSSSVRILLKKYLKKWGEEPVLATNGIEALDVLRGPDAPRLVIVDWIMPEMEGPELIERIRKTDPKRDTYIIMLTSKTGREVLETAFRCGADDYLTKPIVTEDLYRRIQEGQKILERQDAVCETVELLTKR